MSHLAWLIAGLVVVVLLPGGRMFDPRVCFKSVPVVFAILYIGFRYDYHHTVHYSLTGALVLAAAPAFFGVLGLLEGSSE